MRCKYFLFEVFPQCSVHTTSGVNSLDRQRYAWQVRLIADTGDLSQDSKYPSMGDKLDTAGYQLPRLWPSTLPAEDAVRASGHLTLTRTEWLRLLLSHPQHLLVTNIVRTLEMVGAFNPHHPLIKTIVNTLENIGLFS